MGFFATNCGYECRGKMHPPSKKRAWGFSGHSHPRARRSASQVLEPQPENRPTPTAIVSGVHFYGYRYYSPELGGWVSRDPIGEQGGPNLYGAVYNDLINGADPFGLWERVDTVPIATVASARVGDATAAERTTWQLWRAASGDTISSLVALLNGSGANLVLGDWSQWLSLEEAGPGAHSLPNLIQPCDVYKVKRYGAFIGTVKGNVNGNIQPMVNATVFVAFLPASTGSLGFTSGDGRYGVLWLPAKGRYEIYVEDWVAWFHAGKYYADAPPTPGSIYLNVTSKSTYIKDITYGEVKTVDFLVGLSQ